MINYETFLSSKLIRSHARGVTVGDSGIHPMLFPFQRDITKWACRKGKAAMFLDTGLGKTYCQLEWAKNISGTCLSFAPLTVAKQTRSMAKKIGLDVKMVRDSSEMQKGINITNYDLLDHFLNARPDSVILDESSCLKSLTSVHRQKLISCFHDVPNKLCCTATPSPNDIAEICNHAEFLNVMTRVETLATFFVHDDEGWRLKGHAIEPFYRWLSSWAIACRKPSDLGYDDDGFTLPPLNVITH